MFLPENTVNPEIFYQNQKIRELVSSNRSINIQTNLSLRGLSLLGVPDQRKPLILIDIGCGTGLTQNVLNFKKFFSIGVDIMFNMVKISSKKKNKVFDFILLDLTKFILPIKKGKIDFMISISAFQWFKKSDLYQLSKRTIIKFWRKLKKNGRSMVQFYPPSHGYLKIIFKIFENTTESNSLFIDHTQKKKKNFHFNSKQKIRTSRFLKVNYFPDFNL